MERHKHSLYYNHSFTSVNRSNERKTLVIVLLTLATMAAEITVGTLSGSMALLADGWHMGTHAIALGITLFAYRVARSQANNPSFTFGTGKIGVLAGYTSSLLLLIAGAMMVYESIERLLNPQPIDYRDALVVAVIGLLVNLFSAFILRDSHDHHGHSHNGHSHHSHGHNGHSHSAQSDLPESETHSRTHAHHHDHDHAHEHGADLSPASPIAAQQPKAEDHNLKSAYLHVLADALTSVLAIAALLVNRYFGVGWLDSLTGLLGGILIARWAIGLLRDTSKILLDSSVDKKTIDQIRNLIESEYDNQVCDIHIWRPDPNAMMATVALFTSYPQPLDHYRQLLSKIPGLMHVIIEINACDCNLPATNS